VDSDARKAINYLATRNINLRNAKWVMTQRVLGYLQDLRDGNSNLVFPSLQGSNPTFKGYPVLLTTNWAENLGGGGNETHIAFIAFDHVLYGDTKQVDLQTSSEAAYYDAGAVMRSAFQRGETIVLATAMHDFNVRHLSAIHVLTAVKWGA
jgi:HK97 family phage major capsid protein